MGCQADTSWLIALLDGADHHHAEAVAQFESLKIPPAVSALTIAEVLSRFPTRRSQRAKKLKAAFPSILAVETAVAARAADIRVEYQVSLGEAIIIASALAEKQELLTFDQRMKAIYERLA